MKRQDFDAWAAAELDAVESALSAWVPTDAPARLGEAMRYGVLDGGKRLRPLLVLAAAQAVDGERGAALRAACAVELIHAYSLVHGDMPCMDNDVLRRGKPTVHEKFGEAQAMLAGDAMQALAFEVLTPCADAKAALLMGRHAGHIALHSGLAGGAEVILIPEKPIVLAEVCEHIRKRQKRGRRFSIVVVAEGAKMERSKETTVTDELDEFGHVRLGGIGNYLAREIERETAIETRATVLGHIQRGGTPTARDRVLGTRYGVFAVDLVRDGKFGMMAALRGDEIVAVSLEEATKALHLVDPKLYEIAEVFFG